MGLGYIFPIKEWLKGFDFLLFLTDLRNLTVNKETGGQSDKTLGFFSFTRTIFFCPLRRIGGSKTYVAKRFLPRGGTEKEGVTMKEVNTTYFWTPIEDIDFSLGVVVPVSHSKDELSSPSISSGKFFLDLTFLPTINVLCPFFIFSLLERDFQIKLGLNFDELRMNSVFLRLVLCMDVNLKASWRKCTANSKKGCKGY